RRIDIERLRLGDAKSGPRSRVAAMREADFPWKRAHVARAEHVAHQAGALVHVEGLVLGGDDAGRILAAVLQQQQAIVEQLVHRPLGDYAYDSAHGPGTLLSETSIAVS